MSRLVIGIRLVTGNKSITTERLDYTIAGLVTKPQVRQIVSFSLFPRSIGRVLLLLAGVHTIQHGIGPQWSRSTKCIQNNLFTTALNYSKSDVWASPSQSSHILRVRCGLSLRLTRACKRCVSSARPGLFQKGYPLPLLVPFCSSGQTQCGGSLKSSC